MLAKYKYKTSALFWYTLLHHRSKNPGAYFSQQWLGVT